MSELTDILRGKKLNGMMYGHMSRAADEIDRLTAEIVKVQAECEQLRKELEQATHYKNKRRP